MASHCFNSVDRLSRRRHFLNGLDPRVKLLAVLLLLLINALANSLTTSLATLLLGLALLAWARVPWRYLVWRLVCPLGIIAFVIASQTLFRGSEVWRSLGGFDLHSDGFAYGLLLGGRISAGVVWLVLLVAVTPVSELVRALAWLKVPETFVEILSLTYRYIFAIGHEAARMREAQRARLGYQSSRLARQSALVLAGMLFVRTYDRAERVGQARRCRGGYGTVSAPLEPLQPSHWLTLLGALLLAVALLGIGVLV